MSHHVYWVWLVLSNGLLSSKNLLGCCPCSVVFGPTVNCVMNLESVRCVDLDCQPLPVFRECCVTVSVSCMPTPSSLGRNVHITFYVCIWYYSLVTLREASIRGRSQSLYFPFWICRVKLQWPAQCPIAGVGNLSGARANLLFGELTEGQRGSWKALLRSQLAMQAIANYENSFAGFRVCM